MHRWSSSRGFTLIELMVVIAIIGLLMAILFPVFSKARETARQAKCQSNLMQLVTALNQFRADKGYYPPPPYYDVSDPANPHYVGGFSMLYPDYVTERDLLICPDDQEAMQFAGWCRDVVYCSYNGIIDWTDGDGDNAPDDPTFQLGLYNYNGYTYISGGEPGHSNGYDAGPPPAPGGITPAEMGGALSWMDVNTNGIPDWLDTAGLRWQHFPRLANRSAPDYTIVTHCSHHRRYFGDPAKQMDIIVTLGGQTSLVNVTDMGDPTRTGVPDGAPSAVAAWVHQNF